MPELIVVFGFIVTISIIVILLATEFLPIRIILSILALGDKDYTTEFKLRNKVVITDWNFNEKLGKIIWYWVDSDFKRKYLVKCKNYNGKTILETCSDIYLTKAKDLSWKKEILGEK